METARLRGKVLGRPRSGVDTAKVLQLHADGLGVGKIAVALGDVSRETVRRILRRAEAQPVNLSY